jgi:hypothetical protein
MHSFSRLLICSLFCSYERVDERGTRVVQQRKRQRRLFNGVQYFEQGPNGWGDGSSLQPDQAAYRVYRRVRFSVPGRGYRSNSDG